MLKQLQPGEIRNILERGDFESLIGVVEDEKIEAKSSPYQLQSDNQRLELAKDVSGLANASGGVILLGVGTERNPTHLGDEITTLSPFPQSLVDREQYHNVLKTWVYPALIGVEIQWFAYSKDSEKGFIGIFVPRQPTEQLPFLATKLLSDQGKLVERMVGHFERKRSNVEHLGVYDLHSLIRDGLRFSELSDQLGNIQEMLQRLASEKEGMLVWVMILKSSCLQVLSDRLACTLL